MCRAYRSDDHSRRGWKGGCGVKCEEALFKRGNEYSSFHPTSHAWSRVHPMCLLLRVQSEADAKPSWPNCENSQVIRSSPILFDETRSVVAESAMDAGGRAVPYVYIIPCLITSQTYMPSVQLLLDLRSYPFITSQFYWFSVNA